MAEQKKRWRPTVTAYRELEAKVRELQDKVDVLEKSNVLMEQELNKERELRMGAVTDYSNSRKEVLRLRNRGWFKRLLNK